MTGPTPPVLASVRLPEVLPGSGGAEVELPPANKFSIAWQDGQQRHELSSAPVGQMSDSEGERGGSGSGPSEDEAVVTPRRHVAVERVAVLERTDGAHGVDDARVHARADGFLPNLLEPAFFGDLGLWVGVLGRPADVEDLVVVHRLARHGLLGELRVALVYVCDKGDGAVLQNAD